MAGVTSGGQLRQHRRGRRPRLPAALVAAAEVGRAQPAASTASTAASTARRLAAVPRPSRSIIAAERKVASGLATPLPAMSGAEPWTGSNTPGPSLAEARRGQHPERAGEHRRLVAEDVAEHVLGHDHVEAGRRRRRAASRRCRPACGRARRPGSPPRPASTTSRQRREVSSTFALSTEVTRPRRRPAASNATRAIRSISATV